MFDVYGDGDRNCLYILLTGAFDATEARTAADAIVVELDELGEGFDVITELSSFEPIEPAATAALDAAQREVMAAGVGRVVRVVDDTSRSAELTFARHSKRAGYEAGVVETVAEAERLLDA